MTTSEREQYMEAVESLANSYVLHSSESLCKLLRFLAHYTLQNPGAPIKEYQIATEVFGRPANFDSHVDSTIRVQAGRLRAKLAEYYASEGVRESILVELPKGTYSLTFHRRLATLKPKPIEPDDEKLESKHARRVLRNWATAVVASSALLFAAVVALVAARQSRTHGEARTMAVSQPVPTPLRTFWQGFVKPSEPWVIFSNAAFVGRPETGMRYRDPARDSGDFVLDHYTGVGEVLAVHELDHVFHVLNHEIRVKRGSLFSLDDAKDNNLIFVGSPVENLSLRDIPTNQQFVFERRSSGSRKGELAVANTYPRTGEPAYFFSSSPNAALSEDYAVVALMRGMNPTESVLILAGTTTIGTQAAVEYVCHEDSLARLLSRLNVSQSGEVKPFEVVLHVKVARGVPVESEIVAVRNGDAK